MRCLAVHNWLFPETQYLFKELTFVKDRLAAILEQPFIISSGGLGWAIVEKDLLQRGFIRIRNDDYYNPEIGVILEDLHDECTDGGMADCYSILILFPTLKPRK